MHIAYNHSLDRTNIRRSVSCEAWNYLDDEMRKEFDFNALQYIKYSLPVAWESGQDSSSVSSFRETDHEHLDETD